MVNQAIGPKHTVANWHVPEGLAFEWHERIDSTSSELMRRARAQTLRGATLIAAGVQTAGRGRMERVWHGSENDTLMMSLAYAVPAQLALDGLSLTLGVGVAQALNETLNARAVTLKWPNDLLLANKAGEPAKKLGGLLVESLPFNRNINGALVASRWLIVGLGLNLRLAADTAQQTPDAVALESAWTHLQPMTVARVGSIAATGCYATLRAFESDGFDAACRMRWHSLHAYAGLPVRYTSAQGAVTQGCATGVDETGALLIAPQEIVDNNGMQTPPYRLSSTDGSLRLC